MRCVALASGVLALLWLILRSGTKPTRLTYPCQQAALGTASAAFGLPAVAVIASFQARTTTHRRACVATGAAATLLTLSMALFALVGWGAPPDVAIMTPPPGYTPHVYLVNDARGNEPGRYGGVDDLVTLMGARGLKLHRSETATLTAGPDGLIDRDDVVLLKINAQWPQRGSTNTDVLRGVIRRIVEHPDGFTGEVIVADNGQGGGSFTRVENNAVDHGQSPQDVVDEFFGEGWNVSTHMWDTIRDFADEYATGDMDDGYIVNSTRDAETGIKVSYPKFQSAEGTYISYKYGIWSNIYQTYDADKLVVINMPVLKTHRHYAITAGVKNHMGVVWQNRNTDSHDSVALGGLGSLLAEVRMPDLTILDCIWILARPGSGPDAYYDNTSRRDQLVAGTDPVALDAWAAKYIMMPQIIENGYTPQDYGDRQNPDNPAGKFRIYLDLSMNEMLIAGIEITNQYEAVELHVWAGDSDRDGDLDLDDFAALRDCITGPGTPMDSQCAPFDFDGNGTLDLNDLSGFQSMFTNSS